MIPRYSHPHVNRLWSDQWTFDTWLEIELQVLEAQRRHGIVPAEAASELISRLRKYHSPGVAADEVRVIESTVTHHDVAAFLKYIRDRETYGQWLHFGLTSSDLVETAQAMRFRELRIRFQEDVTRLLDALTPWVNNHTPVLGMTHGQPAEPTSIGVRARHWEANLAPGVEALILAIEDMLLVKLSGPVGTYAHNPPEIEREVAAAFGLIPAGPGASQVMPRSILSRWADAARLLCSANAKIAIDLRLMNMRKEVSWPRKEDHVGSSAMAHKNNPIEAEKLAGLSRMASGYALMLQDPGLWLERDISNSSVERVAVPDLWHTLLHSIATTTQVLEGAKLDEWRVQDNLEANANAALTHKTTLDGIRDGMGYEEAREAGLDAQIESYDFKEDCRWFTRNYPGAQ